MKCKEDTKYWYQVESYYLPRYVFFYWGITFSELFIANNHSFFTSQINLPYLQSYNSSIYINSTNKLLTLTIASNNNDQIKFREIVIGPDEKTISNSTFQKTCFSTIKINKTEEYSMVVTNTDKQRSNTSLYIFFGIIPFLKDIGKLDTSSFIGLIIGIISFGVGVILFALGIILLIKDRNKQNYRYYISR